MPEELKSARLGIFKDKNVDEKLTNYLSFLDDNNNSIKKYNFRPYDQNQSFFLVIKEERNKRIFYGRKKMEEDKYFRKQIREIRKVKKYS